MVACPWMRQSLIIRESLLSSPWSYERQIGTTGDSTTPLGCSRRPLGSTGDTESQSLRGQWHRPSWQGLVMDVRRTWPSCWVECWQLSRQQSICQSWLANSRCNKKHRKRCTIWGQKAHINLSFAGSMWAFATCACADKNSTPNGFINAD